MVNPIHNIHGAIKGVQMAEYSEKRYSAMYPYWNLHLNFQTVRFGHENQNQYRTISHQINSNLPEIFESSTDEQISEVSLLLLYFLQM